MIDLDRKYFLIWLLTTVILFLFFSFQFYKNLSQFHNFYTDLMRIRLNEYYEITNKYLKINLKFVNKFRLLSICSILYGIYIGLYLNRILVTNSFMTSNVLLNTERIISDRKQLLNSFRKFCSFKKTETYSLVLNSPNGTILNTILNQKSYQPHCLFDTNAKSIDLNQLKIANKNSFLLTSYSLAIVLINMFISILKSPYYISKQVFSCNLSHLLRKN